MIFGGTPETAILNDPDLVFLLNAGNASSGGDGITGGNGTWYDMSGNGKDFAVGYDTPTWRDDYGGVIGFAGATLGNSDHFILDVNVAAAKMTNTTMFVVVKNTRSGGVRDFAGIIQSSGGGGDIFGIQGTSGWFGAAGPSGNLGYNWSNATVTWRYNSGLTFPLNKWCLAVVAVDTSVGATFYMCDADNGIQTNVHSYSSYGTLGNMRTTRIGRGASDPVPPTDPNWGWQGDYAMAGMYTRTLNYGEVEKIYNSLKSKYGI
jgi:hypothetical protein